MRILVCEDDDVLARGLRRALERAGYEVERVGDVAGALASLAREPPHLALVDLTLPDGDGSEVVARLRAHPAVGVLILSARDAEPDRVLGLRSGADDYVVKPFGLADLLARVDALARRTRQLRAVTTTPARDLRVHGDVVVDRLGRTVRLPGGEQVSLTQKECHVLVLLVEHAGAVVPRDVMLDLVWGSTWDGGSRSLDTHMATLRSKLGDAVRITTVRGTGYRLEEAR